MNTERQGEDFGVRFHNFGIANRFVGRDVRFQISPNTPLEAFTIGGDYLPDPLTSETMFVRFEAGKGKSFDNLPYGVEILDSELFYIEADAVGNKNWKAKVYIAGHHDGFGYQNGRAWSPAEQVAFASITITPWEPGKITANLIPSGRQNEEVEQLYRKMTKNNGMRQRAQNARMQIFKFREERSRQEMEKKQERVEVVLLTMDKTKSLEEGRLTAA